MKRKTRSVRLPTHIIPIRYQITIRPDLEAFTFSGQETITIKISRSTKEISLHSKDIQIERASLGEADDQSFVTNKIKYDEGAETTTIIFKQTIKPGIYQLKLIFAGLINDQLKGFYRSKYTVEGQEKFLAITQFEATDARRAFPCFDEPDKKAIFHVTLVVPEHHTVISNTLPTRVKEHEAGIKAVSFAPTPKMSTYLLAYLTGEFEYLEGTAKSKKSKKGVQVRIYTTPGKKQLGKFSLDCAIRTLEFFEKYFEIAYPLPTLDLIALPDFAAGAMENWGAITFRETALLVDEKHSATITKQSVAGVIAHEIAHQWFGNLVTMKWWTHLWLNEGFATFMAKFTIDQLYPKWDIWTQFAYTESGAALKDDARANTHPIEIVVHHPAEINEIFDAISYQKGASIIRMLTEYLGYQKFREGLRYYLKKHAYKNTETEDLWAAFEKVSHKPVSKIMTVWTSLAGFPVVTAQQQNQTLMISQSRFFSSRLERLKSTQRKLWPIPLTINSGGKSRTVLFDQKVLQLRQDSKNFKLNDGEVGFYRVDYNSAQLTYLKKLINKEELGPEDRLGVLSNVMALAESGQIPTTEVLSLLRQYRGESNFTVWLEIISALSALQRLLDRPADLQNFDAFARNLLRPISRRLSWKIKAGESHNHRMLRGLILNSLAHYNDEPTIRKAKQLFKDHLSRKKVITPDFRSFAYHASAETGSLKDHRKLVKLYKNEPLHEEQRRVSRALAAFRDPLLVARTLDFAMSKNVRPQDTIHILAATLTNRYGQLATWRFIKKHWKELLQRYANTHLLSILLSYADSSNSENFAKDWVSFFKRREAPGCERTIAQVAEQVLSNHDWKQLQQKAISEWLKSRV